MKTPEAVKSVVRTMRLLESLSSLERIGVTDLAKRVGMNKSTAYRFLNSLKELGYVSQDDDSEQYSLTLKLFEIGNPVLDRMELWREAQQEMKGLSLLSEETIHLAILEANKLVYLGKIDSPHTLRVSMGSRVGQSAPMYCTGLGKALLANIPAVHVSRILKKEKIVAFTEKTIIKRTALDKELAQIRRAGYAIDNEEHELGVSCIAAPIRDNRGEVVAAISISMPSIRLTKKSLHRFRELVVEAAAQVSYRLGYKLPA
jgi:IclR family KDG regulon transcriptional repressor